MLFLDSIKLKLKLLPEEDVLNDFNAFNPSFWKSFLKSVLNHFPSWFGACHFVLCSEIFCKEVCNNIPPVLREVPLLKIRKFVCKPYLRLQVSLAYDFDLI